MMLWYIKPSLGGVYSQVLTPSSYGIDLEDLDADSYRAITTGNLISNIISRNWSKLQFNYNCLDANSVNQILNSISVNPIYVKALHPLFPGGYVEAEFRCSKKSFKMLETGEYTLSFNLVQTKKVSGQ